MDALHRPSCTYASTPLTHLIDVRQHRVHIISHLVIPKAQHTEFAVLQSRITRCIRRAMRWFSVLAAVQFDDDLFLEADKVDDVRTEGHLPPKFPLYAPVAEVAP